MYKTASKGFVFSKHRLSLDLDFLEINDCFFYYESNLEFRIKKDGDTFLLLIGTFLDIRDSLSTIDKSLDKLFCLLRSNNFYDELDYYSGKYSVIYGNSKTIKALSDATGMKSIYYNDSFKVIASHFSYFKVTDGGIVFSEIEEYRIAHSEKRYRYGYPGFYTPYKGYKILPPNFEVDFSSSCIRRFFPRGDLDLDLDINEITADINLFMKNQVSSLIVQGKKLYSSLTAGVDSRYTLTATKDFKEITHFTYFYKDNISHLADVNWSTLISKISNINYVVLDIDASSNFSSDEYKKYSLNLRDNSVYGTHAHKISFVYAKSFLPNSILIRSNLYEIGRSFFAEKSEKFGFEDDTSLGLAKKFTYLYDKSLLGIPVIENAFLEYSLSLLPQYIYNYDPIDLFYWEHRMGIWHALVVAESDPAIETVVLCNARKIFNLFLSVSKSDRKQATLFKHAIQQYLPELKNIPINKIIKDRYDSFDVVLSIDKRKLYATIHEVNNKSESEYAFYIYFNGKKIDTQWYSSENSMEYTLDRAGSYEVRGFIKTPGEDIIAKTSNAVRFLGETRNLSIDNLRAGLAAGKNNISTENYMFETYYSKGTKPRLVILLNGAVGDRKKVSLPVFHRYSWAEEIEDHVLNINDPTLNLDDNLRLGWYVGMKKLPLLPEIESVILGVARNLRIPTEDIVIYGSSGGGFAALNITAYIGQGIKGVAINPQINIKDYIAKNTVDLFYKVSGFERSHKFTSITKMMKNNKKDFKVLIYQNKLDEHHYNQHFIPFLTSFDFKQNELFHPKINNIVFNDSRGHVGESRGMFSKLIETIRA